MTASERSALCANSIKENGTANPKETKYNTGQWNALIGAFLALCSGIFLNLSDAFIKFGAQHGVSPSQQLAVKSFIMVIIMTPPLAYYNINILTLRRKDVVLNTIKSVAENGGDIMFYYAIVWIGLGNATAISCGGQPVVASLIACILLRERCTSIDVVVIILNIAGIVLISRPEFLFGTSDTGPSLGYIFAVITSFTASTGAVCSRGMTDNLSIYVVMMFNGILGIVVSLPVAFIASETSMYAAMLAHPPNIGYVAGMVGFYLLYCWSFNSSLQLVEAGRVIVLFNFGLVVSFLMDAFVFKIAVSLFSIIGAVIIFLTSLATSLLAWKEKGQAGIGELPK